ncbi:MAG TPA: cytochrome b/b6 domain-containing protein [Sumerlaeia bacterium]|nr:cytochrome b/b6 domain-containing protein [Sumerlaeia bacterium]
MTTLSEDKRQAGPEHFQRFSLQFRVQHVILFVSTIVLIVTGAPLWCMREWGWAWWSQASPGSADFIAAMRLIHRVAAVVLIAVSAQHMVWAICTREGRRDFIALLPTPKDFADVTLNSLYFLGLRKERPRFGRYTYYEKFDYWAVYWGCVIMIGSGLVLWFDGWAAKYMPWFPYEMASLIHRDEAILAALALFIWHFYNVHFCPPRFPGTLLWWHGRMSREEMLRDHPLECEKLLSTPESGNDD